MFNLIKPLSHKTGHGGRLRSPFSFFLLLTCLVLNTSISYATTKHAPLKAWFKLVPATSSLLVLPICQSEKNISVHYKISATKIGPAGQSKNNQAGQVLLTAQQETTLSNLRFGFQKGDHYEFSMQVFIHNSLVANISTHYP